MNIFSQNEEDFSLILRVRLLVFHFIEPTCANTRTGYTFWRKAVKVLKKVLENLKKYRKIGRKPESAILHSLKIEKKICQMPEKAYFFCGKLEKDPLFLAL